MHLLLSFTLFLAATNEMDTEIHGLVTKVYDGNTLEILTAEHEGYRVVLAGIDCPELTQEYGSEAKALMEKCALQKKVTLTVHGKDRLKNYVGVVMIDRKDVRLTLLKEGLAWTSENHPDLYFESIRREAAGKQKGLWKEARPTPPWIYRREQSMREAKSR